MEWLSSGSESRRIFLTKPASYSARFVLALVRLVLAMPPSPGGAWQLILSLGQLTLGLIAATVSMLQFHPR